MEGRLGGGMGGGQAPTLQAHAAAGELPLQALPGPHSFPQALLPDQVPKPLHLLPARMHKSKDGDLAGYENGEGDVRPA